MNRLKRAGKLFGMDVFVDPDMPADAVKIIGGIPTDAQKVTLINLRTQPKEGGFDH